MNVAIVGSNFGLRGYLPAINKIRGLNVKIICSRNKNKIPFKKIGNLEHETNWKNIFKKNIDLIILAVPPKLQEQIILYNLKYKKKIIFEKPISSNYLTSKKIVEKLKTNKIKSDINLTYLNHSLFLKTKKLIDNKSLGKVINYNIYWDFVSSDFNKKIKSWKTDEKNGGGIKNIFLTHVLAYSEFFFKKINLKESNIKISKFKGLKYKKVISIKLGNPGEVKGDVLIFTKKKGFQSINLQYKWQEDQWVEALKLIKTAADTYVNYKSRISLKEAFPIAQKSSNKCELDWETALENYRNSNRHTIQENTWRRKHLPVINAIFFYVNRTKARPHNGKRLWDKVSNEYQHGKNLEKKG